MKKPKMKSAKHKMFTKQETQTSETKEKAKMDKTESRAILIEMGLSDKDIEVLETGTIEERARMLTAKGFPMAITETITIGEIRDTRTYKV